MPPKEWLNFLREQFPEGTRIRLREAKNSRTFLESGSTGTLDSIDDSGQFHLRWDNGESSVLVIGEDSFSVLPPEPTTLKLLMPLTAELYVRDDYGEYPDEAVWLNGWDLLEYEDKIRNALVQNRVPEEKDRGIMCWYPEEDMVNRKVCSAVFSIEGRDGRLWGAVDCSLMGRLTPEELVTFKDYVSGQASDGWGEGFEQRPINCNGSELYVHLWNAEDWSIQTEEEFFSPEYAEGSAEMEGMNSC